MWMVVAAAIALCMAWRAIEPHLVTAVADTSSTHPRALEELLDRKERALQALKDLDAELATGKLSTADFNAAKEGLSAELAQLLRRIEG